MLAHDHDVKVAPRPDRRGVRRAARPTRSGRTLTRACCAARRRSRSSARCSPPGMGNATYDELPDADGGCHRADDATRRDDREARSRRSSTRTTTRSMRIRIRRTPPCARTRRSTRNDEHGFWALSRHADVVAGVPRRPSGSPVPTASRSTRQRPARRPRASMSFLAMDEPRHGRMRRLVSRGLHPAPGRTTSSPGSARSPTNTSRRRSSRVASTSSTTSPARSRWTSSPSCSACPTATGPSCAGSPTSWCTARTGVFDVPPAAASASLELAVYYLDLIAARRRQPPRRPDLGAARRRDRRRAAHRRRARRASCS